MKLIVIQSIRKGTSVMDDQTYLRSEDMLRRHFAEGKHYVSLREARLNIGKSLEEAAGAVGITVRTLKNWEANCGKVNLFKLSMLCVNVYSIGISHVWWGAESVLLEVRAEFYRKEVLEHVTG
ncbi:hypothetical protein D3C75_1010260 [compost metagenome]